MKVHWTHRAKARLNDIAEYIAKENPTAAQAQVGKILRRSWKLAQPPEIGRRVNGYDMPPLREVLLRPYRIVYLIKPTQIDIITVLHYRQILPQDLLSFEDS